MTPNEAVTLIMAMFLEEYPRSFRITDERVKLWEKLLEGFAPEIIVAAATQLLRTQASEWPPTPGMICNQALNLSCGQLTAPNADEAWLRVNKYSVQNEDGKDKIILTPIEKECLECVGGSWQLRRSTNIAADRAAFIRSFNKLAEKDRIEKLTLPEVKTIAGKQLKLLEEKNDPI